MQIDEKQDDFVLRNLVKKYTEGFIDSPRIEKLTLDTEEIVSAMEPDKPVSRPMTSSLKVVMT